MTEDTDTLADLEFCDEFVTFSSLQARGLLDIFRSDYLLRSDRQPDIRQIKSGNSEKALNTQSRDKQKIRTLMFVITFYGGEFVHGLPLIPDILLVDWQCRMMTHLRGWGYKEILKPHPECDSRSRKAFTSVLGAEEPQSRFEDAIEEVDGALFDMPYSSTFATALESNKPVILVGFEMGRISPACSQLFDQRCARTKGWFDNENQP
jgi:hypothetical protein